MVLTHSVLWFGKDEALKGNPLKVGDKAPDFRVVDQGWKPFTLADTGNGVRILASAPSLDTGTCSAQTQRFNKEVEAFGGKVSVCTVTMDLPWAQKRFCGEHGISHKVLSDTQEASFGMAYGTLMTNFRLLARGVFVIDAQGIVRYADYHKDTPKELNYEPVLAAVKSLL